MGNKPSSPNELAEQVNRSNARIKNDFDNSINTTARVIDRTNKIIDDGFNREISQPITAGFNKEIAQPITAGFNKEIAQPFNKTFSKANMEKFDDGLVTVMKDSGRILNKSEK